MISLVVPPFNEAAVLQRLHDRVTAAAQTWGDTWERVLVDDGSWDETFEIVSGIAAKDRGLKVLSFSRNFGIRRRLRRALRMLRAGLWP